MLETDVALLKKQETDILAKWWCQLNLWEWPIDLPNPESREYTFGGRRDQIMDWIQRTIGLKACLGEWNRDMTDEEFEDFWRGHHEGDEEAKARYRARLRQRRIVSA